MLKMDVKEEKILLTVIIILLSTMALYRFVSFKSESVKVDKGSGSAKAQIEREPQTIYACITGEVKSPGIYKLKDGDRVNDLIIIAGGFTADADTSGINLAAKLKDEEQVNVMKKITGDEKEAVPTPKSAVYGGKININLANAKELDDFLPGVGETIANNIINYRNKNGKFKTIEELTNVDRIGKGKLYERIKDMVTVN